MDFQSKFTQDLPKQFQEKYIDPQFPPLLSNVSKDLPRSVLVSAMSQIEWRRASFVFNGKEVDLEPYKAQMKSDCSNLYLSLIFEAILQNQKFFMEIFECEYDQEQGMVKFWLKREDIAVYMDDFLPVYLVENNATKYEEIEFMFVSPEVNGGVQLLFPFLEKLFAKIIGSYEDLLDLNLKELLGVFGQSVKIEEIRGQQLENYSEESIADFFLSLKRENCLVFLRLDDRSFTEYYFMKKDGNKDTLQLVSDSKEREVLVEELIHENIHLIKISK